MKDQKLVQAKGVGKDWRNEYKGKLVSAEEAVKVIKSGDRVVFPLVNACHTLGAALAARKDELRNVTFHSTTPTQADVGMFYELGMQESFQCTIELFYGDFARTSSAGGDAKWTVYLPGLFSNLMKPFDERPEECPFEIDVVMVGISPPDKDGYCSFGGHLWNRRSYCQRAKTVIAEVNETLIRTGGTNFIHVSDIDYFVEYTPPMLTPELEDELLSGAAPGVHELVKPVISKIDRSLRHPIVTAFAMMDLKMVQGALTSLALGDPPPEAQPIADNVSQLVKDGDTFQIGTGWPSMWMIRLGAFDDKQDLGIYSEMACPGYAKLVERGIVTGKYKTFHPGKVTVSSFSGCDGEDFEIIDNNPIFEQYDSEYILDIRNISQNDNFVAINNSISVDLTGQINSETGIGSRIINGHGGQPEMHMGAIHSKGGRAITLLPSTALDGAVSRIVAELDQGAIVTIPRYFADYVVTEYGIASLMGKDCRQRADELIAVAHPDFREELKQQAKELFYPRI
jgi:4-hydroxybutyrate CoA-transferase